MVAYYRDLLNHIKWTNFILIIDIYTEPFADVITRYSHGTVNMQFSVNYSQLEHDINTILDVADGAIHTDLNFLVLCRLPCVNELFRQANGYESQHVHQAWFTYQAKWLVILDTINQSQIEPWLGQIRNVAIGKKQSHNSTLDVENCCLYTALYIPGRRQFECLLHWNQQFHPAMDVFPNIKYGLNGVQLKIGTNVWSPFVIKEGFGKSNYTLKGIDMDLLKIIAASMNFTFLFSIPEDKEWGVQRNGSWTGMVGQLAEKKVDLVIGVLTINHIRSTVIDFSSPYWLEYYTVLLKLPDQNSIQYRWNWFLKPFAMGVWICFICAAACVVMITFSYLTISAFVFDRRHSQIRDMAINFWKRNMGWEAIGPLFNQGIMPSFQAGRVAIYFWWLFCVVLAATYSGNLVAFQTVNKIKLPFNSLDELVQSDFKYGVLGGGVTQLTFQNAKTGVYQKMWKRIAEFNQTDDEVLSTSHETHVAKVLKGHYAYVIDDASLINAKTNNCLLVSIKETFFPNNLAVGMQKRSAYKEPVSKAINRALERGLMGKWKNKWQVKNQPCSLMSVGNSAVTLSEIQGMFYWLLLMMCTAFIAFLTEMCAKRMKKDKT